MSAATIDGIAREAGVSRGVVTYHFADKEEILGEVLRAAMHDADQAVLNFQTAPLGIEDVPDLTLSVARLTRGESDWWWIYVAFLAEAHTNDFYRKSIASVDERYRKALSKALGDRSRATIVLSIMKGLAMQSMVNRSIDLSELAPALQSVIACWVQRDSEGGG